MQTHRDLIIEPIGLDVDALPKPLNWQQLFANSNPVEIEIGSGKGTFLVEQATAHPEINFLGIEWARWFFRYASDRLRRHGCTNTRMVRAEANFFLTEFVPPQSVCVLHIYFPDPWPKARHHKRRLIQPTFMPLVNKILTPRGRLQVVTDHQAYFEENIDPAIRSSGLQVVDYNRPGGAGAGEFVGTNFERKYAREGRPFFALAAIRQ